MDGTDDEYAHHYNNTKALNQPQLYCKQLCAGKLGGTNSDQFYKEFDVMLYGGHSNWVDKWGRADDTLGAQYVSAFYWSIVNLKGTDGQATSQLEVLMAILVMLTGGGVYTVIVGDVINVCGNLDAASNDYKKTVDNLATYCQANHIEGQFAFRLRLYFTHCKDMFKNKYYKNSMMRMSPLLRAEVATQETKGWVNSIPFFRHVPRRERREFITEISMAMQPNVFVPKDNVVTAGELNKSMWVITKGMAVKSKAGGLPEFLSKQVCMGVSHQSPTSPNPATNHRPPTTTALTPLALLWPRRTVRVRRGHHLEDRH